MTAERVSESPAAEPWRSRLDAGIDRIAVTRRWAVTTALVAAAIGVFLASPSYQRLNQDRSMAFAVQHSRGSLFDRNVDPLSQQANLTFRVVPRIIGKVLHVSSPWHFLVVQAVFGLVLLWAFALLAEEALGDRGAAVLLTVATACTWAGATAWLETRGLFDAVAIAFLLLAMRTRRPFSIAGLALLASFTDERTIFVLPLLVLWHVVRNSNPVATTRSLPERPGRLARPSTFALVAAVVAHLAIRTYLKHRYGLAEGQNRSPGEPFSQLNNYPNGIWGALEGMWVFVGVGLVAFWQRGWRLVTLLALASTGVIVGVGVSVFDITRSLAYLLPLVPLVLVGARSLPRLRLDRLVWMATVMTMVWPVVYAGGSQNVNWSYPLPLQVFRAVFHLGSS